MTQSKICWKAFFCLLLIHFVSDLEIELYEKFVGIHLHPQNVYYHDFTIAVVENGPENSLLNCELIEVNDEQRNETLDELSIKIGKPIEVTFNDMMEIMSRCNEKEPTLLHQIKLFFHKPPASTSERLLSLSSLFIYSGTKWCGAGKIAKNYFDLGSEMNVDKCCRAHDFCPVKIEKLSTRYNLTNIALYTKSHCICDDELLRCLRASNEPSANKVAKLYFNLLEIECIEEIDGKNQFRSARHFQS